MKEVAVKFGINKIHKLKIQMECQQENIHAHTKNLEVIHLAVKSFVECYIFVLHLVVGFPPKMILTVCDKGEMGGEGIMLSTMISAIRLNTPSSEKLINHW